ncbi:MAG: pentapeptide repeat-containing protein [Cyanobacteria bacterium P01_G01_bin.54]
MANRKHIRILEQGVEVWNQWRKNNPNTEPKLQDADRLNSNLQDADLKYAHLGRANLQDANLRYADLQSADLQDTNLKFANLQGADLRGAYLQYAELQFSKLQDADLQGANLQGINFNEANLQSANLQNANLQSSYLQNTDFQNANLQSVNIQDARLQNADLHCANLQNADLQSARLQNAHIQYANLKYAKLQDANLQYAGLQSADLQGVDFQGANLQKTNLQGANLQGANLQGVDFQNADLQGVVLIKSQALFTDFSNANLTGACIAQWGINEQTNFTGVQCDFIYLGWDEKKQCPTDRRPHNPDEIFAPGDFARLMEQARDTVDLIFGNGIDWQAFLSSFQDLQISGEHGELSIQNIGRKSDGSFVISVEAPPTANKAAIERNFQSKYDAELKRLEASYQTQLQLKDEQIAIYRSQNTNMTDIVKMLASRPINVPVNVETTAVAENQANSVQQEFQGPVYGAAGTVQGAQIINAQPPQNCSTAAEVQILLQQLSATHPSTTTLEQMQVAIQAIEQIENDATFKANVIAAARGGLLEGLRASSIGAIVAGAIEGWLKA